MEEKKAQVLGATHPKKADQNKKNMELLAYAGGNRAHFGR